MVVVGEGGGFGCRLVWWCVGLVESAQWLLWVDMTKNSFWYDLFREKKRERAVKHCC